MKVTVKEKTESEIDFSMAGQILISTDKHKRLVLTTGKGDKHNFSGVPFFECENSLVNPGEIHNGFNSCFFKKFNGTITIEQ